MSNYTGDQQREHVRGWVTALRSGGWTQGQGVLRYNDAACCLGVACELLSMWRPGSILRLCVGRTVRFDDEKLVLPFSARSAFGIRNNSARFDRDGLAALNDAGMSFSELADLIESDPPGLFAFADGKPLNTPATH